MREPPPAVRTGDARGRNARVIPVTVDGLRRVFDQRTSWRTDDGLACAVASVVRSAVDWMDGVLLPDVSRSAFDAFRERERWYRLLEVPTGDIDPHEQSEASRIEELDLVLVPTGGCSELTSAQGHSPRSSCALTTRESARMYAAVRQETS